MTRCWRVFLNWFCMTHLCIWNLMILSSNLPGKPIITFLRIVQHQCSVSLKSYLLLFVKHDCKEIWNICTAFTLKYFANRPCINTVYDPPVSLGCLTINYKCNLYADLLHYGQEMQVCCMVLYMHYHYYNKTCLFWTVCFWTLVLLEVSYMKTVLKYFRQKCITATLKTFIPIKWMYEAVSHSVNRQ